MNRSPTALDRRSSTAAAPAGREPGVGSLPPGETIAGKYRLVRYLAHGSMSEVWLATHLMLRSDVAIKFVRPALARDRGAAPVALERFRFEAQVSAKLSALTRNVVLVHDAGAHDDIPYLIMEYVAGPTLEEVLARKGSLAPGLVADILDQAAEALHAAHSIGVVHRDLKPSNLMILPRPDGGVLIKVADFGVAKATDGELTFDRPRDTLDGEIVGSPAFMSPEQIRGASELDARSDIWSLGVVAYEVMTGVPCFEGATVSDCLVSILSRPIVPPSRVCPGLSPAFDAWFARALAKDPKERFTSARQAAEAFRSALARAPRATRARRIVATAVVGTALVVVGAGVAALAGRRPRTTAPQVLASSASTVTALPTAPAAASDPSSIVPDAAARPGGAQPTADAAGTATPRVLREARALVPPFAKSAPPPPLVKKKMDPSEIQ
jgi:serine/threonine-protein kinase